MSDTREKLINWLLHSGCDPEACESCEFRENNIFSCLRKDAGVKADYLIANGVTVQEWIPVSERLPEKGEYVLLMYAENNYNPTLYAKNTMAVGRYDYGMFLVEGCSVSVTHWMPLPSLPKGE